MTAAELASIIVVTGPTASGKTGLAIELAKKINAEIINADSVQVYKYFDIGAAKPEPSELAAVTHHLISVLEPHEDFNAGIFIKKAKILIEKIKAQGKNIIICGGTGLYIKALLHGLLEIDNIAEEISDNFEKEVSELEKTTKSKEELSLKIYEWLKKIDSEAAKKINRNDQQRISRAILVKLATGKSIIDLQTEHSHQAINYRCLTLCLLPDREKLYSRINARVDKMISGGLVEETATIIKAHGSNSKALHSIGYAQADKYLKGEISAEEMAEDIKKQTRRFAKRQYTWWRHQPAALKWEKSEISIRSLAELENCVLKFLEKKSPFNNNLTFIQELTDTLT